jgi:hypothetical protein
MIGECQICGEETKLSKHHLIPKHLKIHTIKKSSRLFFRSSIGSLESLELPCLPENLYIFVCNYCHKQLHKEGEGNNVEQ